MLTTPRAGARTGLLGLLGLLVAASVALAGCGPRPSVSLSTASTVPARVAPAPARVSSPVAAPGTAHLPVPTVAAPSAAGPSAGSRPVDPTRSVTGDFYCPSAGARPLAKSRLAADLGFIAGTVRRRILRPWRAGSFVQQVHGRNLALDTAAGTAELDIRLLEKAAADLKADPSLCTELLRPMDQLEGDLSSFKRPPAAAHLLFLAGAQQALDAIERRAGSARLSLRETTR